MSQSQALVATHATHPAVFDITECAMQAESVVAQVQLLQSVMNRVMKDGEHYGTIPGCGDKPTLFKAGAEKILMTFRLAPAFRIDEKQFAGGHREYTATATLTAIASGQFIGQGVGVCSTMESKYRFRKAEQTCPKCGQQTIFRGKHEYGGGWYCNKNKGGCGAKFQQGDPAIENQAMGRVEHDNPADYYNTCSKMAQKRALVAATLVTTAASDIFTQDVEDNPEAFTGNTGTDKSASTPPQQQKNTRGATSSNGDKMTGPQMTLLSRASKEAGLSDADLLSLINNVFGKAALADLTKREASQAIDAIRGGEWKPLPGEEASPAFSGADDVPF